MSYYAKIISGNIKFAAYLSGFLAFIVFVYVLIALKIILIPFTISVFLTFLFHPLLKYFKKFKIPKWVTLIFIFSCVVLVHYYLILFLISNLAPFQEKLQEYSVTLAGFVQKVIKPFNITLDDIAGSISTDDTANIRADNIYESLKSGVVLNIIGLLPSAITFFFISLIFWVFMILGKEKFEERLKLAFSGNGETINSSIVNIDKQLQSYIFIKTILSLAVGLIATVILLIYDVEFALLWGLLTFLLNFIPHIGALTATVAPLLVSLLKYGFGFETISLAILLTLTHSLIGNFLEPHYLGKQMDLSPVFVLFSLVFWGILWGIAGMFLAVPIAACMKILFDNIEHLRPIAYIIGTKNQ